MVSFESKSQVIISSSHLVHLLSMSRRMFRVSSSFAKSLNLR